MGNKTERVKVTPNAQIETTNESSSSGSSDGSMVHGDIPKKKEYTVNVVEAVEDTKSEIEEKGGTDRDSAEFARQERLRKQREKQAKFQQEIKLRQEVEKSKSLKENNLLVEDGDDMWDVLTQFPANIDNLEAGPPSPKRKRSFTVDGHVEPRQSPRILKQMNRGGLR